MTDNLDSSTKIDKRSANSGDDPILVRTFPIPPSFASFFLVAAGWLVIGVGPLRDFLASWNLLNAAFVSFFVFGTIRYSLILDRYKLRLGKNIKSDTDYAGLGFLIIIAFSLAFFIHYETFTFWQDTPWSWYWLPVVTFVSLFWWLVILISLAVFAPFMFFFNESAVRRFLAENNVPKPDSDSLAPPPHTQPSPMEATRHHSEPSHQDHMASERDADAIISRNAEETKLRLSGTCENEDGELVALNDSVFENSTDTSSLAMGIDRQGMLFSNAEFDEESPEPTTTEQWRQYRDDFYKGEANVHESTSNVDTYTLEAALFGGLAFSSIVSIVSSEKYEHAQFTGFIHQALAALVASMRFDFSRWNAFASAESDWVLPVLLALSIFSGAFFLASLFCRIPFSRAHRDCKIAYDTVGRKLSGIRKAARRVGKNSRKKLLGKKLPFLKPLLSAAKAKYEAIDDIVNIMRAFRVAGLVAISLILVAVCARVNVYLCWMVMVLIAIGFSNMVGAPMARLNEMMRRTGK